MSGKRPYGISLRGVDSERILSKKKRKEVKEKENSSNSERDEVLDYCLFLMEHNLVQKKGENSKPRKSNEEKAQKQLESMKNIQSQIKFVERYLSFTDQREDIHQKQWVQSDINLMRGVTLKDNLIKILTEVISNKKKWSCPCGKDYASEQNLLCHRKKKHKRGQGQNQMENQQMNLPLHAYQRRTKIKIQSDWKLRVAYLTELYLPASITDNNTVTQSEFDILALGKSKKYFQQFFTYQNEAPWKTSCVLFTKQISNFIKSDRVILRVWNNNFEDMATISNIFYGWLMGNNRQNSGYSSEISVEFYLQMYIIFNQWCFHFGYCKSFVTKNREFEGK